MQSFSKVTAVVPIEKIVLKIICPTKPGLQRNSFDLMGQRHRLESIFQQRVISLAMFMTVKITAGHICAHYKPGIGFLDKLTTNETVGTAD